MLSTWTRKLTYHDLIFPSTFNIEFNGKSIEPKSNKIDDEVGKTVSFWIDKWNVSLNGDELTLKTKDTDETFILKHALHVKLHKTPSKLLEDGGLKSSPTALFSDEIKMYPAKVISKPEGSEPLVKSYEPVEMERQTYANKGSIYELTDKPNEFGRMKLTFPMTASLEGAQQEIHSENMEDTFTVNYTADIQANKNELPKNLTNGIQKAKKRKTSTIGRLRMQLQSGDLLLETSSKHRVFIRHEVVIEIDLDSEVPSILINPAIKRHICDDDIDE
ncbi:hypothetical protein HCN44_001944 [Aphidius gifuensis]|uniref:Uncharacterized protein n=1 Tax=Aphidius gifuensis TaxID=684658 RepID=A0A834Y2B2_APHGI|nr:hypothetical protein HCN44_001944 [Aphidius gifuensis]